MMPRTTLAAALVATLAAPLVATLPRAAAAQASAPDPLGTAYQLSLQFAVPVSPAFKLVDVTESAILRPTSFHQFSSVASGFTGANGGFALPKEFGLELAPWFLARGKNLSLTEYNAKPWLARFRVSAAAKRGDGEGGPTQLAFGIRFAPRDASDPRTDPALVAAVTAATARINAICVARATAAPGPNARPGVVKSCADPRDLETRLVAALATAKAGTPAAAEAQKALDVHRAAVAKVQPTLDSLAAEVQGLVEPVKRGWLAENWNRDGIELAAAVSALTADSLGNDPRLGSIAFWGSRSMAVGTWGQVVLGLNGQNARDSASAPRRWVGNAGLAFYVGGEKYRGYVEAQASVREALKAGGVATVGGEALVVPGVWVNAAAGWQQRPADDRGRLLTRLSLRTKLPGATPAARDARTPATQ